MATLPNNILRAGPWGNMTEMHADEVTDFSTACWVYPVNCALGDWPGQAWAAYYVHGGELPVVKSGTVALGEDATMVSDIGTLRLHFCYQAAQEISIDFTWEMVEDGTTKENFPHLGWNYDTEEGTADSYFNTPTDSGTETIVLPASAFGEVEVFIGVYTFSNLVTVTASLSATP